MHIFDIRKGISLYPMRFCLYPIIYFISIK